MIIYFQNPVSLSSMKKPVKLKLYNSLLVSSYNLYVKLYVKVLNSLFKPSFVPRNFVHCFTMMRTSCFLSNDQMYSEILSSSILFVKILYFCIIQTVDK